jgi:hypothetical protein
VAEAFLLDLRLVDMEAPRWTPIRRAGGEGGTIDSVVGLVELFDLAAGERVHGVDECGGVEKHAGLGQDVESGLLGGETAWPAVENDIAASYDLTGSAVPVGHVALDIDILINDLDVALTVPAVGRAALGFGVEHHPRFLVRRPGKGRDHNNCQHDDRYPPPGA